MKTTQETKHTHEFRLEEVLKLLVPEHTPGVDIDSATMRLVDGGTTLVLELNVITINGRSHAK